MIDLKHYVRKTEFLPPRLRSDNASVGVQGLTPPSRTKGFLGVLVDTSDRRGVKGVPIVGTIAGSAAARVGLSTGDTISSISGVGLFTGAALGELISACLPGEHVTVAWVTPQGTGHFACVRLSHEPHERRITDVTSRAA
jgi:S1-C subfamily serine protease